MFNLAVPDEDDGWELRALVLEPSSRFSLRADAFHTASPLRYADDTALSLGNGALTLLGRRVG